MFCVLYIKAPVQVCEFCEDLNFQVIASVFLFWCHDDESRIFTVIIEVY